MEHPCRKRIGKVLISGTKPFVSKISSALEIILEKDPDSWELVQKNLTTVVESEHSGVDCESGAFSYSALNSSIPYIASGLIHEAWYCEYSRRGEPSDGELAERRCMEKQNEFLEKAGYGSEKLDIEEKLKTRYWEIPFEEREW